MIGLVASLGMYDHPAQHAANDALWAALAHRLRHHGIVAPLRLDRARPVETIWRDPGLLLAQACGYPLVSDATLDLRVVAVPSYDLPGLAPGRHHSHIVVRHADGGGALADHVGRRAAVNAAMSNSGCNLFRAAFAGLAIDGRAFAEVITTGSHAASVAAVRTGAADIAAIDAVSYAALARYEPEAVAGLRILASTPSSPALPFVTAHATSRETLAVLRAVLTEVARDPALRGARDALFLADVRPASVHRFAMLRKLDRDSRAAGYPDLR